MHTNKIVMGKRDAVFSEQSGAGSYVNEVITENSQHATIMRAQTVSATKIGEEEWVQRSMVGRYLMAACRSAVVHKKTQTDRKVNTGERQTPWTFES